MLLAGTRSMERSPLPLRSNGPSPVSGRAPSREDRRKLGRGRCRIGICEQSDAAAVRTSGALLLAGGASCKDCDVTAGAPIVAACDCPVPEARAVTGNSDSVEKGLSLVRVLDAVFRGPP